MVENGCGKNREASGKEEETGKQSTQKSRWYGDKR
jgi:hypothetical protein